VDPASTLPRFPISSIWPHCGLEAILPIVEGTLAMSRTVAIVQARMGSSRLPGKVLTDIGGQSMLQRVVSRAARARLLDAVVVATTTDTRDDAVVRECDRLGVLSFRGSENDVLDRYYGAARAFEADTVVRITSDCPLIDPQLVDRVVGELARQQADYASNTLVLSYPRGLDAEAFTMASLTAAWENATEAYERVHVTPFLYRRPDRFKLVNVACAEDVSSLRWTVDTPDDLRLLRCLFDRAVHLGDPGWEDVLEIVRREPALRDINGHIRQKALEEG
jgi:spore coat polysaccharide biosynthesis protein SpsF